MSQHDYVYVVGLSFGFFAGLGLGLTFAFHATRKLERQLNEDREKDFRGFVERVERFEEGETK